MAGYYRASFTVEKLHTTPEERGLGLLERVVGIVREWAGDRLGKPLGDTLMGDWAKEGATLHIDRGEFDASGFWRLVLEHPADSKAFKWRTDFRLATQGEDVEVDVEVRRIDDREESPGPGDNASRPRVLLTLFEKFECSFDGERLTTKSEKVTQESVDSFVRDLVFKDNRRMPVVVVTENRYGGMFIAADYLQSRLLGLANVFTYDDNTAKTVNEHLGHKLWCQDGTVRVYRPGCSASDVPGHNMFWSWFRMDYLARREGWAAVPVEIADECFRSLPQPSLRLYDEVSGRVRQIQYERLLEKSKNTEDVSVYQELLKEADSNIENYKRQNTELREKNDELQRDNDKLRSQVEQLTVLSHQDSGDPEPEDTNDDVIDEPEFDSVHQVVEYAEESMRRLRFFPYAVEQAKGSQFPRPNDVYQAFKALNECADERVNGSLGMDAKRWLREKRVEYTPRESESTMNKHGDKRKFWDEKQKRRVEMQEHVKLGGGTGENNQLRIHISWQENEEKWLVGYIGRHLPTAKG